MTKDEAREILIDYQVDTNPNHPLTQAIDCAIQALSDGEGWAKVRAVKDDSGHWYVIPNELCNEFYKDEENNDMIDSGEFDDKYYEYRTFGDLNLIQLFIPSPPKLKQP